MTALPKPEILHMLPLSQPKQKKRCYNDAAEPRLWK